MSANENNNSDSPCVSKAATIAKWISVVVIVACVFLIARQLPVDEGIKLMRGWIDDLGVLGPIVFGVLYVVAALLLVPGSVLTIAAGGIFGLWLGTAVVSIASTTSAALALLIARFVARKRVEQWAEQSDKFRAMDNAISEGGWKIVAMLRLSPAIPFNIQNYFYGLTSIGFWRCVLTSWVSMLPGTFLFVYVGHLGATTLDAAADQDQSLSNGRWIMLGLGLAATVAVTVYITWLARKQLKKQTNVEESDSDKSHDANAESPSSDNASKEPCTRWPPSATITIAAAVLAVITVFVTPHILALLGPPKVTLTEAYARQTDGPTVDHALFNDVLQQHVDDDGWVDYVSLKADPQQLDNYVAQLAAVDFESLGRDEKLALLINAYNAFTLKLIIEYLPLESIWDIPDDKRWADQRWSIGTMTVSLWDIENKYLRPNFIEARIHFAINCASVGCPKLSNTAYTGKDIEEQLSTAARTAHVDGSRWFRFDDKANTAHVSSIYKWYRGDFEQVAGSLAKYLAKHVPAVRTAINAGDEPAIEFMSYDWSLNAQSRK